MAELEYRWAVRWGGEERREMKMGHRGHHIEEVLRALPISTAAPVEKKANVTQVIKGNLEVAVHDLPVCGFYFFLWALVILCPILNSKIKPALIIYSRDASCQIIIKNLKSISVFL